MATLGHTSVSSLAVRSLMSLCLIEGRAPVGQLKACSTEKLQPHTQCEGIRVGFQPYRRHNSSLKDPLWRAKLCSAMGSDISLVYAENCRLTDSWVVLVFTVPHEPAPM